MQIISVDETKCIGCNKCVRVCPVHEANITKLKPGSTDEFVTNVREDKCINCGECVKSCKHGARVYVDNSDQFFRDIKDKTEMAIIVAPSIRTALPGNAWGNMLNYFRNTGNVRVYDVAYGADICTWGHYKMIKDNRITKCISQPCPAIVNYIEKYKPTLLRSLSPVQSPASCLAIYLKKYIGLDMPIYLLSPCIAKTNEAQRENTFDYNVTFQSLMSYFDGRGINLEADMGTDFKFDLAPGILGQLYPRPGGLRDNLAALNPDLIIRTSEGPHSVYRRLDRYAKIDDVMRPDVLDVLNCEFGCNMGTATVDNLNLADVEGTMDKLEIAAQKERGMLLGKDKRYKEFDHKLNVDDFLCTYVDRFIKDKYPSVTEIDSIFNSMLKETPETREINCTSCGYESCYDMCVAIYKGLNIKENCVYYMKYQIKQSYQNICVLYKTLQQESTALADIIKGILDSKKIISDDADSVIVNAEKTVVLLDKLKEILDNFSGYFHDISVDTVSETDLENVEAITDKIQTILLSYKDSVLNDIEVGNKIKSTVSELSEHTDNLNQLVSGVTSRLSTLSNQYQNRISGKDEDQK
ncbi:MAG: [Fe-Fe] hydrogenase large subunit C-terminal domain-containing protein [Oscillospiraceae bacterium]|nr:[Fe-Fe] hydrogenase large subunit C-terminal domain-containing protein [Oscillospiraceae bacterium]